MASTNNHGGSIVTPSASGNYDFGDLSILNTKIIGTSYLESLFGTNVASKIQMPSNGKNSSCLEQIGMAARNAHLNRNEWSDDMKYTKSLIDGEYLIQTEFKVN